MTTTAERDVACIAIRTALLDEATTTEQVRSALCAVLGHPPLVNVCFGQITCARCDEIVGDTLMGGGSLEGSAIVGHACSACAEVCAKMVHSELLMLPDKARQFVAQMRAVARTEANV